MKYFQKCIIIKVRERTSRLIWFVLFRNKEILEDDKLWQEIRDFAKKIAINGVVLTVVRKYVVDKSLRFFTYTS